MGTSESADAVFCVLSHDDEYLLNNTDTVYPILIKCFSRSVEDAATVQALRIAFGPYLNLFPLEDVNEKLLQYAYPIARNRLLRLVKDAELFREHSDVHMSKNILHECKEIVSQVTNVFLYIMSESHTVDMLKIKSLLVFSSEALYQVYGHCAKSQEFYDCSFDHLSDSLSSLFEAAQELQRLIFLLLPKVEIGSKQCEVDGLNEILTFIYKSGIVLLSLDVKTMADLWKGYTCAIEKYSKLLKCQHEISVPVECLSLNLIKNIENHVQDYIGSEKYESKRVTILCFILKVIIKLTEKFIGYLRKCQHSLIKLLIILTEISNPCLKNLNESIIGEENLHQLVIGMEPLLNCLLNDQDFAEQLTVMSKDTGMNASRRFGLLVLYCLIIKKLTFSATEVRQMWFNSDNNILQCIFHVVSTCNFHLFLELEVTDMLIPSKSERTIDCFEYILTHISVFLLMATAKEFAVAEKILLSNILKPNPLCSLLSADLWCMIARFGNADLCRSQFSHLCEVLLHFETRPVSPEILFFESLTRRLFSLMSQKHRDWFAEVYPPKNNLYLWRVFGIDNLSEIISDSTKSAITNLAVVRVNKFLSSPNDLKMYFLKMESALLSLDLCLNRCDVELENNLGIMWKFDSSKLASNPLCKRYLKFISAAASSIAPFMSSKTTDGVFHSINASLRDLNPSCQLYCVNVLERSGFVEGPLLRECSSKLISSLFHEFLIAQNIFIRMRSMDVFSNFAYFTAHTEIVTETINNDNALQKRLTNYLQRKIETDKEDIWDYMNELELATYNHCCDADFNMILNIDLNDNEEPPNKKVLLSNDSDWEEVEDTIALLKNTCFKLTRASGLSSSQRKEVSLIADLLYKLVE